MQPPQPSTYSFKRVYSKGTEPPNHKYSMQEFTREEEEMELVSGQKNSVQLSLDFSTSRRSEQQNENRARELNYQFRSFSATRNRKRHQ